jgi:DNA primase
VTETDIGELLDALGIKSKREGKKLKALCPAHKDSSPSWSIIADGGPKNGSHHCFACGFNGGPWELVAAVKDLELTEAAKWIRETFSGERKIEDADVPNVVVKPNLLRRTLQLPHGVQIPSVDGSEWSNPAYQYLVSRGIPDWQIERWHIGFATRGRCAWRVIVPVHTRDRLVSYVARAFLNDGRMRYLTPARSEGTAPELALFGEPGFDMTCDTCTVAEGVFSAMALERAGAPNPRAILGASSLGPMKLALLNQFRTVLVATDPDRAGDKAFEELHRGLSRRSDVRRVELVLAPDDSDENDLGQRVEVARNR